MPEVLYLKYRPQKFSEVVGQEHVTTTLVNSLKSGKISHAYLFAGPRGTGKTSVARILAKAVNCTGRTKRLKNKRTKEQKSFSVPQFLSTAEGSVEPCDKCDSCQAIILGTHLDLIEIDAASTRGIDDVRELREAVDFRPALSQFKVYILDEVHMLTKEAFNALLKTLEEPPPHSIFVLCTTEPHRVPSTIVSRCQRHDFKLADVDTLIGYLKNIVKKEKVKIDPLALELVAKIAEGAYRDAVGFLEQVISYSGGKKITFENAQKALGLADKKAAIDLINFVTQKEVKDALNLVNELAVSGIDLHQFLNLAVGVLREELQAQISGEKQKFDLSYSDIVTLLRSFSGAEREIKNTVIPQLPIELVIVEFCSNGLGHDRLLAREPKSISSPNRLEIDKGAVTPHRTVRETALGARGEAGTPLRRCSSYRQSDLVSPLRNVSSSKDLKSSNVSRTAPALGDIWSQVLTAVKSHNHSVEALLKGCQPKKLEGDVLTLEFFYQFHKERIEETKNRRLVETVAEEIFGKPVKIRCVLGETAKPIPKKAVKEELDESDLVEIAKEIFGGEIIK